MEIFMGTAMVTTNQGIADEYVRRYQQSTKNAIEGILNMGEAVYEIYTKFKSKELSDSDFEYFCKSVNLDSKGSSFRKYKAIGRNADKFRLYMDKLPSSFSVLYEMATLDADDFERYVVRTSFSKEITLEHLKKMMNKSSVLTKNKLLNPPSLRSKPLTLSRVINKINRFEISIVRDLPQSDFDRVVQVLSDYRNKGWIRFEDPEITESLYEESDCGDVVDDSEKYFTALLEKDIRELRV
jgi:hypothetical protein